MALAAGGLLQFAGFSARRADRRRHARARRGRGGDRRAEDRNRGAEGRRRRSAGRCVGTGSTASRRRWIRSRPMSVRSGRRSSPAARAKIRASGARRRIKEIETASRASARAPAEHRPPKSPPINEKIAGVEALAQGRGRSRFGGRQPARRAGAEPVRADRQGRRAGRAAEDRAGHRRRGAQVGDRARRAVPAEIETFAAVAPDAPELAGAARLCRKGRCDPRRNPRRDRRCGQCDHRGGEPADRKCRLLRAAACPAPNRW